MTDSTKKYFFGDVNRWTNNKCIKKQGEFVQSDKTRNVQKKKCGIPLNTSLPPGTTVPSMTYSHSFCSLSNQERWCGSNAVYL